VAVIGQRYFSGVTSAVRIDHLGQLLLDLMEGVVADGPGRAQLLRRAWAVSAAPISSRTMTISKICKARLRVVILAPPCAGPRRLPFGSPRITASTLQ